MIRWGIIGVGNIAQRFITSLVHSKNGELVAIASRKKEVRERYSHLHTYENYQDLLKDTNIDAIYIALPHALHGYWSKEALKHKKAVLCEKPVTLSSKELMEVIQYAKENNTFFMEAMKTKFTPGFKSLKKLLENEEISEITAFFCEDSLNDIPKTSYFFDELQGGSWYDVGSYLIAFCNTLMNQSPKNIESHSTLQQNIDIDGVVKLTYDNATVTLISSKIEKKDRVAYIKTKNHNIEVHAFNRTDSYIIDGETFTISLQFDDFYDQIEEVHTCLAHNLIESPIHSFDNMIQDITLLETVAQQIRNK